MHQKYHRLSCRKAVALKRRCLSVWMVGLLVCFAWLHHLRAQAPIEPLMDGFANQDEIWDFAYDTNNDLLFISGAFQFSANGVDLRGLAYYDGVALQAVPGLIDSCQGPCETVVGLHWFQDTLWISRAYDDGTYGITRLSGTPGNWSVLHDSNVTNARIEDFTTYRGEIYALGAFTQFLGLNTEKIARKTASGWVALPSIGLSSIPGAHFHCGHEFNDELYIGGDFSTGNYQSIAKWNGTAFSPVGNGLTGSVSWVNDFATYKGQLYVGGGFYDSDGNPGNNVVVLQNGVMQPLGLGLTYLQNAHGFSEVSGMEVLNNRLYVSGAFHFANRLPASRIAYYDGVRWCAPSNDTLARPLGDMAVYQGDIIVDTQGWYYRNTDTLKGIAKLDLTPPAACGTMVSVSELGSTHGIRLFPQPAQDQFFLEDLAKGSLVQVYDLTGRQVRSWIAEDAAQGFSLQGLQTGVYLIRVPSVNYSSKLVKKSW